MNHWWLTNERSVNELVNELMCCLVVLSLQRPHELQDFLRRVEDSIRTSNSTLQSGARRHQRPSISVSHERHSQAGQDDSTDADSTDACCAGGRELRVAPDGGATPTYDAMTQTSPMSLSRASSILWAGSDCNCSSVATPPSGATGQSLLVNTALLSVSRPSLTPSEPDGAVHVNMDTSMSSLVSELSDGVGGGRRSTQITPDSAAAADVDAEEESSVSLSRSLDPLDCGGVESGIGTGSPPPRDRRRRPVAPIISPPPPPPLTPSEKTALHNWAESASGSESASSSSSTSSAAADMSRSDHSASSSASVSASKKRDKVRRRETWEKIRRRHSCKRAQSRRNNGNHGNGHGHDAGGAPSPEVVWHLRDAGARDPAALAADPPATAAALPPGVAPLPRHQRRLEPVLHKPPAVVIHSAPRPKPRSHFFKAPTDGSQSDAGAGVYGASAAAAAACHSTPAGTKASLRSVAAREASSASSASTLKIGGKHLKPTSATSTPTESHIEVTYPPLSRRITTSNTN